MLNDQIRQLIVRKFDSPLQYPQQCEALALAIQDVTGKTIGTTTLKRMLGFVKGGENPRLSSLDIIAQYVGYPDYNMMVKDLDGCDGISGFSPVESIDSADLEIGETVRVVYQPNRVIVLVFMGNNMYVVKESHGSKLMKGDRVMIAGFYVGFELLVSDVERDGRHLGPYQAARKGGLTSVEIER